MNSEEVIRQLTEKGFFISPEALKAISEAQNPEELAKIAVQNAGERLFIELPDLQVLEKTKIVAEEVVIQKTVFKPAAKEYETRIKMPKEREFDSSGTIDDFVNCFRNRFEQLSDIFRERGGSVTSIDSLGRKKGEKTRVIAIVSEKKITKNGHMLINLEDMSGTINALVPANAKALLERAGSIVLDDVVCFEGVLNRELFIIENFQHPDLPIKEFKMIEEDLGIALLSDFHVGSNLFMRHNFEHFLSWLKGEGNNEKQNELAGKIKYLTIAGDCVDGIGIYPGQESELEITDIYQQYSEFEKLILQIPEYISVIIGPGNHDAVKNADPQPILPAELFPELTKMKNVYFVGSPATIELHGMKLLMYHGTSFDDLTAAIPGVNYVETHKVMVESLKKRHLHPIYGGKPITPSFEDELVIREIPDIFQAGHMHRNGYDKYRGVICVNSGTWQQVTPYQVKQGHQPTPCILPCVELKSGKISIERFDRVD